MRTTNSKSEAGGPAGSHGRERLLTLIWGEHSAQKPVPAHCPLTSLHALLYTCPFADTLHIQTLSKV